MSAIAQSACALDRLVSDGLGHGIVAVFLVALVVVCVGNIVEEERLFGLRLPTEIGLGLTQVNGADLGEVPIGGSKYAAVAVFETDAAHFVAVGEGPLIVSDVNARLGVERILCVAGNTKEFIEAMMRRAIEHRPREVHVFVIVIGSRFTCAIIESHTDMIFTNSRRAVAARLQHLRQRAKRALDHRRVWPVREPALLLEITPVRKPAGQKRVPRGGTHGRRRVGVVEYHRLLRKRLELRRALRERNRLRLRPHPHAKIGARVANPHVIDHHQNDIRFGWASGVGQSNKGHCD